MSTPLEAGKVPGNNNATFGPVTREKQRFKIEFLEIAPSEIPVDQIFFVWLRGEINNSLKDADHLIDNAALKNATLEISLSAHYPDGQYDPPETYTIPLQTRMYRPDAHIAIRNSSGVHVEYLTVEGSNHILADMLIPSPFLRTGEWTFEVVAKLEDGTCLFALSLTQRLEGRLRDRD